MEEYPDIQLVEAFEDLPAGARGTIFDTYPKIGTYQIEFYEPVQCVRAVPMHIVADGLVIPPDATREEAVTRMLDRWFPDWRDQVPD